jgi:ABC-type Mn2+/Zn2+ transport system ATPase subunit
VDETYALMGAVPPPPVQTAAASEEHRQLARLARAIALRPALLVIDEPGAGLDAQGREDLWRLLWRLQEDLGCAILAATSDPGPAAALTTRTIPLPPRRHTTLGILRPYAHA